MDICFSAVPTRNPRDLIRRCGYGELRKRQTGELSYVKRVHRAEFPRFHVYINMSDTGFCFSLHLDQKEHTYTGTRAHSGEYDGPVVATEAARIQMTIADILADAR